MRIDQPFRASCPLINGLRIQWQRQTRAHGGYGRLQTVAIRFAQSYYQNHAVLREHDELGKADDVGRTARRPATSGRVKPLPYLQRYQFVRTSEPEMARDAVARAFRDVSLHPVSPHGEFFLQANHLDVRGFALGCAEASRLQIHSGDLQDFYVLLLPIDGCGEFSYGREVATVAPGGAGTIHSTQRPCAYGFHDRLSVLAVRLPRERLESHFRALVGSDISSPPEFSLAVQAQSGLLPSLTRLVSFFTGELDRHDTLLASEPVLRQVEELIITMLLAHQPHSHQNLLQRPLPAPSLQQLQAAENYIESHCGQALRMQDIARAAGVSLRSLQLAFQRHRGCSPGGFLRRVRLERARRLLASGGALTVTGVAHACGFLHLGQFAADYRQRFGERPSDTRRKGTMFKAGGREQALWA